MEFFHTIQSNSIVNKPEIRCFKRKIPRDGSNGCMAMKFTPNAGWICWVCFSIAFLACHPTSSMCSIGLFWRFKLSRMWQVCPDINHHIFIVSINNETKGVFWLVPFKPLELGTAGNNTWGSKREVKTWTSKAEIRSASQGPKRVRHRFARCTVEG